ncbi:MAG: putative Oligoendopeptidase F, partial [Streblomastix strix]
MAVIEQLGKSKQVPLRSEIQSKYKWDNYAVYPSDEAWQEDFDRIDILQEPLNQLQGHLGDSVQNVISAFEKDDSIDFIIEKLFTYAKTRHYVDKTDSKSLSLVERIRLKNSTSSAARSWIDPEILSLPEEQLNQYQNHSEMQFWLRRFDEIVRYNPHTLSKKEEELLSLISPALESNSNTYLLLTDADMKYGSVLNDQGEEIELSQGNYIQFLQSSNREVRKNAWVTMHSAHIAKKNTICSALNGQIKSEIFKMKARKYNSCLEHALFGDQIDSQVYKSLIHAVHEKLPSLFKYFSIKQRLLNLEALDFYDMSVPLIKDYKIEMSFEEARELVLQALAPLGDEYVTIARRGLTSKEEGGEAWVDVFENQGKRSNCCSISTYMQVPYILLNYNRDLDDVFTLAHELGHAMHSYLSHHAQPHHMAYYRLVVAEIASTTNEMLLQHFLMEKAQKEG